MAVNFDHTVWAQHTLYFCSKTTCPLDSFLPFPNISSETIVRGHNYHNIPITINRHQSYEH